MCKLHARTVCTFGSSALRCDMPKGRGLGALPAATKRAKISTKDPLHTQTPTNPFLETRPSLLPGTHAGHILTGFPTMALQEVPQENVMSTRNERSRAKRLSYSRIRRRTVTTFHHTNRSGEAPS